MQPIIYSHRSAPPKDKRTQYALGIVTLFPALKDPYSKKGYVSIYFNEQLLFHRSNRDSFFLSRQQVGQLTFLILAGLPPATKWEEGSREDQYPGNCESPSEVS